VHGEGPPRSGLGTDFADGAHPAAGIRGVAERDHRRLLPAACQWRKEAAGKTAESSRKALAPYRQTCWNADEDTAGGKRLGGRNRQARSGFCTGGWKGDTSGAPARLKAVTAEARDGRVAGDDHRKRKPFRVAGLQPDAAAG